MVLGSKLRSYLACPSSRLCYMNLPVTGIATAPTKRYPFAATSATIGRISVPRATESSAYARLAYTHILCI